MIFIFMIKKQTLGSETSQYQEEKKTKLNCFLAVLLAQWENNSNHFLSSGERKGKSPNRFSNKTGL
jgi:hypothetical protein